MSYVTCNKVLSDMRSLLLMFICNSLNPIFWEKSNFPGESRHTILFSIIFFARFSYNMWCHWWDVEHPLYYVQVRGGWTHSGLWLVSCDICRPLIGQTACWPRTDLARFLVLTIKWAVVAVVYKIWRRNGGTALTFTKKQLAVNVCRSFVLLLLINIFSSLRIEGKEVEPAENRDEI